LFFSALIPQFVDPKLEHVQAQLLIPGLYVSLPAGHLGRIADALRAALSASSWQGLDANRASDGPTD
jgi:threonine/homoserine/homoserine lactone efflux protein